MTTRKGSRRNVLVRGLPRKITNLVEGESDRGVILILAAYLDELLGDLISAACISDEAGDDLLGIRRPAGDFESRISLCAAFGLIHSAEASGLQAIRKIRNSAAHFDKTGRGFDVLFDSDGTIDQVGNLAKAVNLVLESRQNPQVKELFIVSARLLAVRVMFRAIAAHRPHMPPTLKEIAGKARESLKGTAAGESLAAMEASIRAGDFDRVSSFWKDLAATIESKAQQ